MGRDITEEVEEETGSAGPANWSKGLDATALMGSAYIEQERSALGQALGGRYKPSPEEKAEMEKRENQFMRREVIESLVPFLGGNKDVLLATARDVVAFIKNG